MYARLGTDSTGAVVAVDTSLDETRVALLGGVAVGKTTTCRFLARSWAAHEDGVCVVLTPRAYEYADLHRDTVHVLPDLDADQQAWAAADLLIVDEAESIDTDILTYALQSSVYAAVVASYGPAVAATREWYTDIYALHRAQDVGAAVQGRLDWPPALDVDLDPRDRFDYPRHRWAV
jgi:hypothetical protein